MEGQLLKELRNVYSSLKLAVDYLEFKTDPTKWLQELQYKLDSILQKKDDNLVKQFVEKTLTDITDLKNKINRIVQNNSEIAKEVSHKKIVLFFEAADLFFKDFLKNAFKDEKGKPRILTDNNKKVLKSFLVDAEATLPTGYKEKHYVVATKALDMLSELCGEISEPTDKVSAKIERPRQWIIRELRNEHIHMPKTPLIMELPVVKKFTLGEDQLEKAWDKTKKFANEFYGQENWVFKNNKHNVFGGYILNKDTGNVLYLT